MKIYKNNSNYAKINRNALEIKKSEINNKLNELTFWLSMVN